MLCKLLFCLNKSQSVEFSSAPSMTARNTINTAAEKGKTLEKQST
jgi:hypothetical protein